MKKNFFISLTAIVFVSSLIAKERIITTSQMFGNFRKASNALVRVEGTVDEILYKGKSVRFVVISEGHTVAVDSYNTSTIKTIQEGKSVKVCAVYLKHKFLKYKGKRQKLPFLITQPGSCN